MRNSTKKIVAIAAALLLSVSGVATTATMAAPAVFAATVVETTDTDVTGATDANTLMSNIASQITMSDENTKVVLKNSLTYNGSAQTQEFDVYVTNEGTTYKLHEGTDYTTDVAAQTDPGQYTVNITYKTGSYVLSGGTATFKYTIAAKQAASVTPASTASVAGVATKEGYTVTVGKEIYTSNGSSTPLAIVDQAYNFGGAVTPIDTTSDLYAAVTVTKDSDSSKTATAYVKLTNTTKATEYTVSYDNNTQVGTATATISVPTKSSTVTVDGVEVPVTFGGSYTKTFNITALNLSKATVQTVAANSVKATWTGGKISINKSDLQLYRQENNETVAIDTSLYTISKIGDHAVTEKNGVLTFTCTDAPYNTETSQATALTVTYAPVKDSTSLTGSITTASTIVVLQRANWADVVVDAGDQTSATAENVTATLNGVKLTKGTGDYAYKASAAEVAGDTTLSKVTVTPNLNYFTTNTEATYYARVGTHIGTKITSVTLTDTTTKNYAYTGTEIKPAVTVKSISGTTLTEGTDYEVVYSDNVNKGTAKITIKGIGTYAGEVAGPNFTITAKKLSETTVTAEDVTYETTKPTVAELAKAITVKNGDVELVYGTDYTISVNGGVKDGANTVKILPVETTDEDGNTILNYTGSATATVNVTKVENLSEAKIATIANVAYTGEAQTPALTVTLGDKTLVQDTDYTVEYTNNTEAGKATATITGIGAYTGTATKNFVIVPQQVTGLKAVKKTATTLKLQFNAVEGADGYKIYDAVTGKAIASVSTQNGADVLKKTITGLNAGETRKYKVRAYKIVNGTKRYAEYSAVYTKATAKK
jgi:hypothetical protein